MKGSGTIAVAASGGRGAAPETAPIKEGDAIPIQLSEIHSVENKGAEPLELMIVGVSRDATLRVDSVDARDLPAGAAGTRRKCPRRNRFLAFAADVT
jgi:oxalate decarboxylase/phosphoglucose isomerase-like protein (cupin superfamily)